MNALLKVCKTFTINPVTRVSKDVSLCCILLYLVLKAQLQNDLLVHCAAEYQQPGQTGSASPGCESRWETGIAKIHPGRWGASTSLAVGILEVSITIDSPQLIVTQ